MKYIIRWYMKNDVDAGDVQHEVQHSVIKNYIDDANMFLKSLRNNTAARDIRLYRIDGDYSTSTVEPINEVPVSQDVSVRTGNFTIHVEFMDANMKYNAIADAILKLMEVNGISREDIVVASSAVALRMANSIKSEIGGN